jgi:tRNA(fMet)-specific endonuclease VapC
VEALRSFTLAEIRYGYRRAGWQPVRVAAMENTLSSYLLVPLDEATLDTYVDIKLSRPQAGKPIDFHDCWIAATAVSRQIPLVSCDQDHLDVPGLETIYLPPPA